MGDIDIVVKDVAAVVKRKPATMKEIQEETGHTKAEIEQAIKLDKGRRVELKGGKVHRVKEASVEAMKWKAAAVPDPTRSGKMAYMEIDSGLDSLEIALSRFNAARNDLGAWSYQFRDAYKDARELCDLTSKAERLANRIRMLLRGYR